MTRSFISPLHTNFVQSLSYEMKFDSSILELSLDLTNEEGRDSYRKYLACETWKIFFSIHSNFQQWEWKEMNLSTKKNEKAMCLEMQCHLLTTFPFATLTIFKTPTPCPILPLYFFMN
jgi:hypothetical protein